MFPRAARRYAGASDRGIAAEEHMASTQLILVHPPQIGLLEGFSSGLVALANYTARRQPSVDVHVLDLGLSSPGEVGDRVRDAVDAASGSLFVGISTTTASYQSALAVARAFKMLSPWCVVVLGGHHASAQDEVIMRTQPSVDCVVRGEGEIALDMLLRHYPDLTSVPNLTYRSGLSAVRNPEAPLLSTAELDRLPATYSGWGAHSAPGKFDHITYVSARGCPLRCAFCAVANQVIRNKSVAGVIDDLRYLVGELGHKRIAIEDNFFAHSPKRTLELCEALASLQDEMPFRWDCQTRVESCQRTDLLEAMEHAGCDAVYLGVEAFDPEHLLYLRKTSSPGSYLKLLSDRVVPWLLDSRMSCYLNLQLGLPSEGPSHRENTLRQLQTLGRLAAQRAREIVVFPQLHVVYPGTRHFQEAIMEGRFGDGSEDVFERFTAWETRQQPVLRWLGEHFAHGTGGIPEGILRTDLLRRGGFEIDSDAVLHVANHLNEIETIEGVSVFKYRRYLAKVEESTGIIVPNGVAC
jgi:B12 binding domain/Radical SAM superfamily